MQVMFWWNGFHTCVNQMLSMWYWVDPGDSSQGVTVSEKQDVWVICNSAADPEPYQSGAVQPEPKCEQLD